MAAHHLCTEEGPAVKHAWFTGQHWRWRRPVLPQHYRTMQVSVDEDEDRDIAVSPSRPCLARVWCVWLCRGTRVQIVSGTQLGPDRGTSYPSPDTHASTKRPWHVMDKQLMCSLTKPAVVSGLWGHPEDRPSAISPPASTPCRAPATFAFNYYAGRIKKILGEGQQERRKPFMISKVDLLF